MPHPQGGKLLEKEILNWRDRSIEIAVSLLTIEEQKELRLQREEEICNKYNIKYLNFPIKDEIADSDISTIRFVNFLESISDKNNNILFHCRGGVGRSSMMLSLLAIKLGENGEKCFSCITKFRGENAPETEFQKLWVLKISQHNQ